MKVEDKAAVLAEIREDGWSDWVSVIGACGDRSSENEVNVLPASPASAEPFDHTDIVEVVHAYEGENDGDDWILVVRLRDGRFVCYIAGCDYTGWG